MATHFSILAWRIPWAEQPGDDNIHDLKIIQIVFLPFQTPNGFPPYSVALPYNGLYDDLTQPGSSNHLSDLIS